nr:immunoglobulin heavy chain junction region [Macaca mulatta]
CVRLNIVVEFLEFR